VAQLLTLDDPLTMQHLLATAWRKRTALGADWPLIVNSGLLWSLLASLRPEYDEQRYRTGRWRHYIERLRSMFVRQAPSAAYLSPLRLAAAARRLRARAWRRTASRQDARWRFPLEKKYNPGLDTRSLWAAISWLSADISTMDSDRQASETLLLDAFQFCCELPRLLGAPEEERLSYPDASVVGIFSLASAWAIHHRSSRFSALWKAFFDLGPNCHLWIDSFLDSWFGQVAAVQDISAFKIIWRQMIEHFLGSPVWRNERIHCVNTSTRLMGMGRGDVKLRDHSFAPVIANVRDLYLIWARRFLRDEHAMTAFADFLQAPSAQGLVLDALPLITDSVGSYTDYHWRHGEPATTLVFFANHVWSTYRPTIQNSQPHWDAFKVLLSALVNRGLPAALELEARVQAVTSEGLSRS
jgi:hypothetical protein